MVGVLGLAELSIEPRATEPGASRFFPAVGDISTGGQIRLRRRAVLYLENDPARAVFGILAGFVRETRVMADGRLQGVRLVGPGGLVGTESLVRPRYQTAVQAITPARVCKFRVEQVKELLASRHDQAIAMSEVLCREAVALRDSLLLLGPLSAEDRVTALLRQLASGTEAGTWIEIPLTRQELGDSLGLALATVSRVIHRLARRGMLEVNGRKFRFLEPTGTTEAALHAAPD